MEVLSTRSVWCLIVLLAPLWPAFAQVKSAPPAPRSAHEFVQGFYDWYDPIALRDNPGPASDIALKEKRSTFSPELARLLKEDSDAQARCAELIGIDFDPILMGQDPEERYEVGTIRREGEIFQAEIYGVRSGKRFEKPAVIAEFMQSNGRWFFVNFVYPEDHTDLLAILKSPRAKCTVPRPPPAAGH